MNKFKVIILQENLKSALLVADKISSKNTTLPILNNCLFEAKKGSLKISATNLELGIEILTSCKIESEGSIIVPTKLLLSFVNNIPNTKIYLEEDKGNLFVKTDNIKTKIPLIKDEEYPELPKVNPKKELSINSLVFKRSLEQVLSSVVINEIKSELSGINFDISDKEFILASTDNFRLSEKRIKNTGVYSFEGKIQFILPLKTAQELVKMLDFDSEVVLGIEDNKVSFLLDNIKLISQIIDSEYINYKPLIPKSFKTEVVVSKDEFLQKIKLASIFSSNISNIELDLDVKNKRFLIKSNDSLKGEFESEVEFVSLEGEDNKLNFNYKYLIDGILNIDDEELFFGLSEEKSPALMKPVSLDDYIYIIMPMKV